MATRLMEFATDDGPVLVEVEDDGSSGPRPAAGRNDGSSTSSGRRLDEALAGIKPSARAVMQQLSELGPQQTTVEFGIRLSGKAGVILASTGTETHCKVTMTWTRPAERDGSQSSK